MKTYTKKEIAHILDCSVRTVEDDIKYLKIKPVEKLDYGLNLYSEVDYKLVSQLREHCGFPGKTRETFVPPTNVEIVNNSSVKLSRIKRDEPNSIDNYVTDAKRLDPLADLEMLQRIADNKWCLPTKRLAAIIGIRPNTLLANSPYNHCGFVCVKYYPCNGTYLWKVTNVGGITQTLE